MFGKRNPFYLRLRALKLKIDDTVLSKEERLEAVKQYGSSVWFIAIVSTMATGFVIFNLFFNKTGAILWPLMPLVFVLCVAQVMIYLDCCKLLKWKDSRMKEVGGEK